MYPDWKPSTTLEKTDIVGTIEAIEDAQSTRSRDKSALRKSNLNVSNSSEEVEHVNRPHRSKPRDSVLSNTSSASAPLQSILEEDRRKSIIQQLGERPSSDRLQIYIRRPSDAPGEPGYLNEKPLEGCSSVGITNDQHSIYIRSPIAAEPKSPKSVTGPSIVDLSDSSPEKSLKRRTIGQSDKIEIDSDNIETPPSTRRNIVTDSKAISNPCRKLQTPRPLHRRTLDEIKGVEERSKDAQPSEKPFEPENLGDGQFDRYSAARRTRRYRRPTDYSSGNEERTDTSPELSSPPENLIPKSKSQNSNMCLDKIATSEKTDNSDDRLNRWQPRFIKPKDDDDTLQSSKGSAEVLSRVGKVGRNLSSINQEDVREAIRNLKSPTEAPDRIWSPPREIVVKDKIGPVKITNHELNDEGFEETQSLVSDTPSHGKDSTSSYTDQPDSKTTKKTKMLRVNSSESATTAASNDSPAKRRIVPKSTVQTLLERNRQSLERSRSLRTTAPAPSNRSVIPRRTSSLRKSADQTSAQSKKDVERSSSRTSLRSSRSSLNSATSINTVRNVPLKTPRTPSITVDKTLYKKPLTLHNASSSMSSVKVSAPRSSSATTSARTPASRSSSSGSSIGPTVRRSQTKSATPTSGMSSSVALNTSFKENHTSGPPSRPSFRNAVSHSSHSNTSLTNHSNQSSSPLRNTPSARLSSLTKGIAAKTSRVSNFMRPTTASATKRLTGAKGK